MRFHWEEESLFRPDKMDKNVLAVEEQDVVLLRNAACDSCSPVNWLSCSDDSQKNVAMSPAAESPS